MAKNKKETTFIDLEDLRSEYESTYLHYFQKNPMSFEKWLKKEKGIDGIISIKKIKNNMQEEIKKLIKVYEIQKREYDSMLNKYNEKGIEDLDFEETETYGVFLGKSELYENVIDDLKQIISQ
jgi:hypothetical protein